MYLNPFSQGSPYQDDPPNSVCPIYGHIQTTPNQDQQIINQLNNSTTNNNWYSLCFHNCRNFSQNTFNNLIQQYPNQYIPQPRPNPPHYFGK